MPTRNVTIIGGSGFVGRRLAHRLVERGLIVTIPTRNREVAKRELIILPTAELVQANVHADADLDRVIDGAEAVVSLVGILRGDFERAHVELPRRIAEACKRHGVGRLMHVSALCADSEAPSRYLRSKAAGEQALRSAAGDGLALTIFRPSVMFGSGDSFLGMFARMLSLFPVIPLGSPNARFQPVWVEDAARAMADALDERDTYGQTYELCGPKVYRLRELLELTGQVTGNRRTIIGLGPRLSYLQAFFVEHSPWPILTRDNLRSMQVDNVCGCGWPEVFTFSPAALEAVLPTYLEAGQQSRYQLFRGRARR